MTEMNNRQLGRLCILGAVMEKGVTGKPRSWSRRPDHRAAQKSEARHFRLIGGSWSKVWPHSICRTTPVEEQTSNGKTW